MENWQVLWSLQMQSSRNVSSIDGMREGEKQVNAYDGCRILSRIHLVELRPLSVPVYQPCVMS